MARTGAAQVKTTSAVIAVQIRRGLKEGLCRARASGIAVLARGNAMAWRVDGGFGPRCRWFSAANSKRHGLDFLVEVAEQLFLGWVAGGKNCYAILLERLAAELGWAWN
jgi:hypothetical protein